MNFVDIILKTLVNFEKELLSRIPFIIIAIIFLILTHFIAKLIGSLAEKSLRRLWIRANLVIILQKIIVILVWVIGILIAATIVFPSVTTANILAALGLSSIALGFAFKDIIENFLAGILILLREPFQIGDYIETEDEDGTVEHVSVRNTHIRRSDGVRIVVPNAVLFSTPIRVVTDLPHRRQHTSCVVNLDENLEEVREIIYNAVIEGKTVNKDKGVEVYITLLSSSGINFKIYWWCPSKLAEIRRSRDEVLTNIKKALDAADIELSYSYMVNIDEIVPMKLNNKDKEDPSS